MSGGEHGRIFISYRRQEAAWPARQLYAELAERFGADQVFKDVDNINPGDDFVERISDAVASCDILLALVGRQWLLLTDETGQRRIDDPGDFVRIEVATALASGVKVVPILLDGTPMPKPSDLPEDLVALTRRQAVPLDPVTFDTSRLFRTLEETLAAARAARTAPPPPVEPTPAPPVEPEPAPPIEPTPPPPIEVRPVGPVVPARRSPARLPLLVGAAVVVLGVAGYLTVQALTPRTTSGASPASPGTAAASTSPSASSVSPSPSAPAPHQGALAIMAHRGGQEVHQLETQEAMEAAARDGYSIETDVRLTSDGVAVLVHDEAATKGLDCGGRDVQVSKTTWKQLQSWCRSKPTANDRNSYRVPTYAAAMEAIGAASPDAWVFVEIKYDPTPSQAKAFVRVLADTGLRQRAVVTSFDAERLEQIRRVDSQLPTMLFVQNERVAVGTLDSDLWGVAVEQRVATRGYIQDLQARKLKVVLWLLNDPGQWQQARSLAPDVVMTDFPARYTAWLQQNP